MAIGKIYSIDITKGRCKDTGDWVVEDIRRTHEGYTPLGTLTALTESSYEIEEIDDSNQYDLLYETSAGNVYLTNNKWYLDDFETDFDNSYILIYAFGGARYNVNEIFAFFYNTINGEITLIVYDAVNLRVNNNVVVAVIQTGLTKYDINSLCPLLKDNSNNIYYLNVDGTVTGVTLEPISSSFIIISDGILYKENGICKYRNNNRNWSPVDLKVIAPNDFDFEYIKNNIILIHYNYSKHSPTSVYLFVNKGEYADVYFISIDVTLNTPNYIFVGDRTIIINKCKTDENTKITTNNINILASINYQEHNIKYKDQIQNYLLINNNNTLFTINQCIIYPSIKNSNFTKCIDYTLYNADEDKWYGFKFLKIHQSVQSEFSDSVDFTKSTNIVRKDIICGNLYEINNVAYWYNGEEYIFEEEEMLGKLLVRDFEPTSKITAASFPTINDVEYVIMHENDRKTNSIETPHFLDTEGYLDDSYTIDIPIVNNIIPKGLFYNQTVGKIVCKPDDTITFGEYSFYGGGVGVCYAKKINLEYNAFSEDSERPISHAVIGADYSDAYKGHSWYEPLYDLIPIEEYNDVLSFEFSGSSITLTINGENKTFTESPININNVVTYDINDSANSQITKIISVPVNEQMQNSRTLILDYVKQNSFDLTNMNKFTLNCVYYTRSYTGNPLCEYVNIDDTIFLNTFSYNANLDYYDLSSMFYRYNNIKTASLNNVKFIKKGFSGYYMINMTDMFKDCSSLKTVSMKGWDVDGMSFLGSPFNSGCTSLESIDLTDSSMNLYLHIKKCLEEKKLTNVELIYEIDYGNLTFEFEAPSNNSNQFYLNGEWYTATTSPYTVVMNDFLKEINFNSLNYYITKITEIPKAYEMNVLKDLFSYKSKLTEIVGIENLDVSNVTDMKQMFYNCSALTELDLSLWDVTNVTDMTDMFYNCNNLNYLNISNWRNKDIINVSVNGNIKTIICRNSNVIPTGIGSSNNSLVEQIDFSNSEFRMMDFINMFRNCSNLKNINFDGCHANYINNIESMFWGCSSLESIDVSWITKSVYYASWVFYGCTSLKTLKVKSGLESYWTEVLTDSELDVNNITIISV